MTLMTHENQHRWDVPHFNPKSFPITATTPTGITIPVSPNKLLPRMLPKKPSNGPWHSTRKLMKIKDPKVQAIVKAKEIRTCQQELEALALEDDACRKEIAEIVQLQLKEKQESANRNMERLRAKSHSEENKDMEKLLQMYNEKSASNQAKIQHGIKLLSRRHTQEIHKQAQQHRLNAQQRGIPEQMANNEWSQMAQQLQEKHRRQLQEFDAKGEEVKKKCAQDYLRERDKRRKHHDKRRKDMELGMQKVIDRMHQNFQQLHQRYLKRHVQRINKKKERNRLSHEWVATSVPE